MEPSSSFESRQVAVPDFADGGRLSKASHFPSGAF
jgi:hypothetical protein